MVLQKIIKFIDKMFFEIRYDVNIFDYNNF
jgi:hypothetical protein